MIKPFYSNLQKPKSYKRALNVQLLERVQLVYLMAVLLVIHAAFRGTTADLDSVIYTTWYMSLPDVSFFDFLTQLAHSGWIFLPHENAITRFEWGFTLLAWLIRTTGAPVELFYGTICALSLFPKVYVLTRFCRHPVLGLFGYTSFCYLLLEMSAMRAGLASAVMIVALLPLLRRRWGVYIGLIVLASTIHLSAIVALFIPLFVIYPIKVKGLVWLLAVAMVLSQLDLLSLTSFLSGSFSKLAEYSEEVASGGLYGKLNPLNFSSALFFLSVFLFFRKNYKVDLQSPLDKIGPFLIILPLLFLFSLASFPIVAARLYELSAIYHAIIIARLATQYKKSVFGRGLLVLIPLLQFCVQQYRTDNTDFFYFIGKPRPEIINLINEKILFDAVLSRQWDLMTH